MSDDDTSPSRELDEAVLRWIAQRLGTLTLVERVSVFPRAAPESVVARFDRQYYPARMDRVTLDLRVYLDGAFSITYRETWNGESWQCRWDRHDNPHSGRDHFHRPPDAGTEDAVDRPYPADVMAVIELVLGDIDERLGEVWEREQRDS